MKKLLIIALLLTGMQNYAQKTFEVYNYTGMTVQLADIITNSGGSYPEFHSKPAGLLSIAPGGSFTLYNPANVYRFPFNASASITTWERLNTATSPSTVVPSNAAWIAGNSQVFKSMLFYVGSDYSSISAASGTASGSGWTAIYDEFQDPNDPNIIFYTIVIF